jgi:hypothetical protein
VEEVGAWEFARRISEKTIFKEEGESELLLNTTAPFILFQTLPPHRYASSEVDITTFIYSSERLSLYPA